MQNILRIISDFTLESIFPKDAIDKDIDTTLNNFEDFKKRLVVGEFPRKIGNGLYSCLKYRDGQVKNLVIGLKSRKNLKCAEYSAKIIYEAINKLKDERRDELKHNKVYICAVAPSKKRMRTDGYDQVNLLAEHIIEHANTCDQKNNLKVFYLKNLFKPIKKTRLQKTLKRLERIEKIVHEKVKLSDLDDIVDLNNINFLLKDDLNKSSLVIILDDVITTGTTCIRHLNILKEVGIVSAVALSIAY